MLNNDLNYNTCELFLQFQGDLVGDIYANGADAHVCGEVLLADECWEEYLVAQGRLEVMYDFGPTPF